MNKINLSTPIIILIAFVSSSILVVASFGTLVYLFSYTILLVYVFSLFKLKVFDIYANIVLLIYFNILLIYYSFINFSFSWASIINAFITFSLVSGLRWSELYKLKYMCTKFAVLSVYISILMSMLDHYAFSVYSSTAEPVVIIGRLQFIFFEPSHYAVFIVFILIANNFRLTSWVSNLTLYVGLLLTWSLSGFMLLALSACYFNIISKFSFKQLVILIVILLVAVFGIITQNNFWIFSKLQGLINSINEVQGLSSAFVRYQSSIMGWEFLAEAFRNGDYARFFLGNGIGNTSDWIKEYYLNHFGIEFRGETFNWITSIIISTGLSGVVLFFLIILLPLKRGGGSYGQLFVMMLLTSFFSGYAYGTLALFFYMMTLISVVGNNKHRMSV